MCARAQTPARPWSFPIRMVRRRGHIAPSPKRYLRSFRRKAPPAGRRPRSCSSRLDALRFAGAADSFVQRGEKLRGQLLGGGLDKAAAELGHFAAHVGLRLVAEDRGVRPVRTQKNVGTALGET